MRWWILALLLGACDDGGGSAKPADATGDVGADAEGDATRPDGAEADAEPLADAASPADFSLPIDALPAFDAALPPDAGPPVVVQGEPVPATPERLADPVIALAVAGDQVLAERAAGGLLLLAEGPAQLLEGEARNLRGAAALPGDLVVAADGALFVREGNALLRSPLSDRLGSVTDVAAVGSTLWIATADGLFRFDNGQLRTVTPDDLPSREARLVPDGNGLWVGAGDDIYLLAGSPLSALPTQGGPGGAIAVDGAGEVWLVAEERLWWLDEAVAWWPIDLPFVPLLAAAGPGAPGVWLADELGLWHLREGEVHRYTGAPVAHLLAVNAEGDALAAAADGLWRVPQGRLVQINPPPNPLLRPGVARVRPSLPERVTRVELSLDGQPTPINEAGEVALSPFELPRGTRRLEARVTWDDGVQATAAVDFHSQVTTWALDVHPIFEAQCAMCHGRGAAARPLWASEQWRAIMGQILDAVRTGRMPLARERLSPAEIELLQAWLEAEMPEEWP